MALNNAYTTEQSQIVCHERDHDGRGDDLSSNALWQKFVSRSVHPRGTKPKTSRFVTPSARTNVRAGSG